MEERTLLSPVTWTGAAGNNDWDTPDNWSTASVPGSMDDVTINIPADITHASNTADSINSLTSDQPLTISSGSISIATASTLGDLTLKGGTLSGSGDVTVSGLTTLSSGNLAGSGALNADGGMLINPSNSAVGMDGRTVNNAAGQTATMMGTNSNVSMSDGAVFNNLGTFLSQAQGSFAFASGTTVPSFVNAGSFINTGTLSFESVPFDATSGSSVEVQGGDLSLSAGGTGTGASFTSDAGGDLDLGGPLTLDSNSRVAGAGVVNFLASAESTAQLNGTYDVTGSTLLDFGIGTVTIAGTVQSIGSVFTASSGAIDFTSAFSGTAATIGAVTVKAGTVNFGTNAIDAGTLTMTSGTLTSTATITVDGLTTLGGGTIAGSGAVDANGGILMNGSNSNVIFDGRTIDNPSGQTVTWTGTNSNMEESDGAIFDNQGTFYAENQGQFVAGSGAASSFEDQGSFIRSNNSGNLSIEILPFHVTGGSVDVQSGTLELLGGGASTSATFTAEAGGTLEFGGGHTLDANSTVGGAGSVIFGSSTSTTTVAGAYDVTGSTSSVSGGTVNFTGTVDGIGSTMTIDGGTLNFDIPLSGNAGTIGTLTVLAGTVNVGANALELTTFTLDGGTLSGTGDVAVSGLTTLSAGIMSGSGDFDANGGMTINPAGAYLEISGKTVTNAAGQTATWTGTNSNIQLAQAAVFQNLGTLLAENQGTMNQGTDTGSSFLNKGSFIKQSNSQEFDFEVVPFNSIGGTVEVQTGTLGLEDGGTISGTAFTIDSGAVLDFEGTAAFTLDDTTTFSGAGSLTDDNFGTLTIPGSSPSLSGPTTVEAGTLLVNGSQPGSSVSVIQNSTLGGSGTVGSVTTTGSTVSPGDGPGILTVQGNATFDSASTFKVGLDGSTAGTGYDQLNVMGEVNLGGSSLSASLGFTPADGETFTIVQSTSPIVGTFKGLAEGATLSIGSVPFTISYVGGGGDDVVLTQAITSTPTTTTLKSSENPSIVGNQVTFTATVAPTTGEGTPSGDVTFSIDGTPQTPVALQVTGGMDQASFSTSTLSVGPHSISVTYGGDPTFAGSTVASPLSQVVNALATTTTTLKSSENPATVGAQVTFTATVAPASGSGTPSGNATFSIDGTPETPVALQVVGGMDQAVFVTSTLAVGQHSISVTYAGDSTFAGSTVTSPLTQNVNARATTTSLKSSENPSNVGDQVTFTATVAPTSGTGTPSGDVTFSIDGTPETPVALQVVGGVDQAVFVTSALSVGQHSISVTYAGDSTFAGSVVASPLTQNVNARATTTTLKSSENPANVGDQVTFTATVAPTSGTGTPSGDVTFSINGTPEIPVALQLVGGVDQASFSTSTLSVGQHSISVTYAGDSSFASSMVASPLAQVVNTLPTTTTVKSSENPSNVGDQVTFTATVAPTSGTDTPSGDVTFAIDGKQETPVELQVVSGVDQASFSISTLSAGQHSINVTYAGDSTFARSVVSSPVVQVVSALGTRLKLESSGSQATVGEQVTFTAILAPMSGNGTPSGDVTFSVDGTTEPPVALQVVNGVDQATFSISTLSSGQHSITASYAGDSSFAGSLVTTPLSLAVTGSTVAPSPFVTLVQRFGVHMQPTMLLVTFSSGARCGERSGRSEFRRRGSFRPANRD